MDGKELNNIKNTVKIKIIELSKRCGNNASELKDNEIIPLGGYLDSAGIIELVIWIENKFKLNIEDENITIDNLGSLSSIAKFVYANLKI